MCIHELTSCADCPTPEQQSAKHEADVAAVMAAFARAEAHVTRRPAPHPIRVVPVPTTSMHETDVAPGIDWDPQRHRIGTNANPSFVPIQVPGNAQDLFARLAQARPEWVPNHV